MNTAIRAFALLTCLASCVAGIAQEKSVNPGVNDPFHDPDVNDFIGKFEVESREVFTRRKQILAACKLQPGEIVADIGAGTGLFTRMFAGAVGDDGRVIAIDIAQKFLDHIQVTSREAGHRNVETVLCKPDSVELPPESIDVAFICDTYHHFEFPQKTMTSVFRALKPGGRAVVVDFRRIEGTSSDWVLKHVRAGQEVVEAEIASSGFTKIHEEREMLTENYFVVFRKPAPEIAQADPRPAPGRDPRRAPRRGPWPELRADQEVFHNLLQNHHKIRRSVTRLENGVETLTESDDPAVAARIQTHVAAMHQRIKDGRGLRFWDELFVAVFKNHTAIRMTVERTDKGVKVKETSANPAAVALIQAHAEVVSLFVKHGFDEARKNHAVPALPAEGPKLQFPIVPGHGGVSPRPQAVEQPLRGAKVVFDVTADAKPAAVNKGLERAARLLNLYGVAGMQAGDVKITIVVHGEATKAVLNDAAFKMRFDVDHNPNLPLIRALQKAGAEVLVCGQALTSKGIPDADVDKDVPIAASALTVVINRQTSGYACIPIP